MKKLKMETKDIVIENIDKIENLFPNVMTERKGKDGKITRGIDFDKLRQELSKDIIDDYDERYEFTWVGKNQAIVDSNEPIRKTLRPCVDESKNFDTTENLYIEGDNLEVLKLLQESYLGEVKMIYIDPPYNTGKDSFVYNDNFTMDKDGYEEDIDYRNEDDEILFKQNNDSNPKFHSDWCSMIYTRLKLAKNLLKDDGVIFISIDDNEVRNLRNICDEIFGESNFVGNIIWKKKYGIQNDAKYFSVNHDFILCYSKNLNNYTQNLLVRTDEQNNRYKNPDKDIRGVWKASDMSVGRVTEKDIYEIITPSGRKVSPPKGRSWGVSREKFDELVRDNRVWFGADGNNVPSIKKFITEVKNGITCSTIWDYSEVGHTDKAKKDTNELFYGNAIFDYPKPSQLIQRAILLSTSPNDIILDFFSGSATTADAVMQLNAEDGGNRKFIMVQIPEKCDEKTEAFKSGYPNICEIGKERIRRAGQKIEDEINSSNTQITLGEQPKTLPDTGFRVLKVDDSNMKDIYYSANAISQGMLFDTISNIKDDRTGLDLLFGILLDWGLELSYKFDITTIDDITVYNYDNGSLVACLDDAKVTETCIKEIAKLQPMRVVFRDSCFENSASKINLEEIFKAQSPDTEIKVI